MIWNDDTEETTGIIREEKYGRSTITYVNIIRCKDCKCGYVDETGNDDNACVFYDPERTNWFCADGKRKDN